MKILVVEDEKCMAEVLRAGLAEENYCVSVVHDGLAALHMTEENQFRRTFTITLFTSTIYTRSTGSM